MNAISVLSRLALLAGLVLFGAGCRVNSGIAIPLIAGEINGTLASTEKVIVPGDRIAVQFPDLPAWNQEILVQPDGNASLLGIDQVTLAGLSLDDLDAKLTAAYKGGVFDSPDLSVVMVEPADRTVTVIGEVETPGRLVLQPGRRMTIVEALAEAGGFDTRTAHLGRIVLVRWDAQSKAQRSWIIDARPRFWTAEQTVMLQAHDVVYVPNAMIDDVGIWIDNHIRRLIPLPIFPLN